MPKRILFISHGANLDGGAEQSLLNTLTNLDRGRFEPIVVVPKEGDFSAKMRDLEINFRVADQFWMVFRDAYKAVLTVNTLLNIKRYHKLVDIIRQEKIDAVYTNSVVIFGGGVAARLAGVPHLWHIREIVFNNPDTQFGFGPKTFAAVINTLSDQVIAVSQAAANIFKHQCPEKVHVINNPIDTDFWGKLPEPKNTAALRQELMPNGTKILIFIGNLSTNKAPHEAVEALGLTGRSDTYLLLVGGTGPSREMNQIAKAIEQYDLKDRVLQLGFRKDVKELLCLSDVYVAPSGVEPWGNATVQSLAMKVPAVVANTGGAAEIVRDGEFGYTVDPHNSKELAAKINLVLDNPDMARKMGQAGRQYVLNTYTQEKYFAQLHEVLEKLVSIKSRPYSAIELLRSIF